MGKKCQSSAELLVLLAVGLAVILLVLGLNENTLFTISSRFEAEKASSAVNDIAGAVESVYSQGVGAKSKVYIDVPDGINSINISNKVIDFKFYSGGNLKSAYRSFDFNVSGNLTAQQGSYWVLVEAKDGHVSIQNG